MTLGIQTHIFAKLQAWFVPSIFNSKLQAFKDFTVEKFSLVFLRPLISWNKASIQSIRFVEEISKKKSFISFRGSKFWQSLDSKNSTDFVILRYSNS